MIVTPPLITIGITCFNAETTIRRAIDCALNQKWNNKEIVVVDDCSTDSSWNLLHELVHTFPEIRIIRHEKNGGYPTAVNTIANNASGEYLAIFDDDDESAPVRLTEQFNRMTAYEMIHPGVSVLCYSNRNVIRAGSKTIDHVGLAIGRAAPEPYGKIVADIILGIALPKDIVWGVFGSCTMLIRRSLFLDMNGFDESFRRGAEMDFAIRAAISGAHFISVDKPIVTQYKTESMDKSGYTDLHYSLRLIKKYKAYLRTKGSYYGALSIAHMRFHSARGGPLRAKAWYLIALFCLPAKLAWNRLRSSTGFSKLCLFR